MIKWYDNLYMDHVIEKKRNKIKKKIHEGKATINTYCITFASNERNLFDILDANELRFSYYKKKEIYILGLAFGKENAIAVMVSMIEEIYKNTGEFKVREYFKFQEFTECLDGSR